VSETKKKGWCEEGKRDSEADTGEGVAVNGVPVSKRPFVTFIIEVK
jgi:hypothetical protein